VAVFDNNILIRMFCKKVSVDEFGNEYFVSRLKNANGKLRRLVIYNGFVEPSKVPPMWHSWLNYCSDTIPSESYIKYSWQRENTPNYTGTILATYPRGLTGIRAKVSSDYQPWVQENE
jgi:NADH:ubiquinone oxidoreductase subunit